MLVEILETLALHRVRDGFGKNTSKVTIKYASYLDWRLSPDADRRHRPVCHTWLTTVQCVIDFSLFGLGG